MNNYTPITRYNKLKTLKDSQFDALIIGGGATGVATALDAASRGFKVALIDRNDFASSTSSKSTKILHGGVRYLAQGNIDLVYHALIERYRLIKNAPHLCSTLNYIIPTTSRWETVFYGLGLSIYNLLSMSKSLGKTYFLNKSTLLNKYPNLDPNICKAGICYSDGQFDDSRLAITLAKTAEDYQAICLNYVEFLSFIKGDNNRIQGIQARDVESGEEFSVQAKAVINATGCFADYIRIADNPTAGHRVAIAQGTHIILPKSFGSNYALMIPKTKDGRILFAIPWYDVVIVGTTDSFLDEAQQEAIPMKEEIDFILETYNQYAAVKASYNDILSVFAGQRPLVSNRLLNPGEKLDTKKLARDHVIEVSNSGLVSIMAGKWTTCRLMAEKTIDATIKNGLLPSRTCNTKTLHLSGYQEATCDNHYDQVYGSHLKIIQQLSGYEQKLHPQFPFTIAHVYYAIIYEYARNVIDVLARRIRLVYFNTNAALECAPLVADILASELQWDKYEKEQKLQEFKQFIQSYLHPEKIE